MQGNCTQGACPTTGSANNAATCPTTGSCDKSSKCEDHCPEKMLCDIMCLAKCAKKEVMKDKLKAHIEKHMGGHMDQVAELVVGEMLACWKASQDKQARKSAALEKFHDIMSS